VFKAIRDNPSCHNKALVLQVNVTCEAGTLKRKIIPKMVIMVFNVIKVNEVKKVKKINKVNKFPIATRGWYGLSLLGSWKIFNS